MSDLERLHNLRSDLTDILVEQDMLEDDLVQQNLALIDLELEGLSINLPGQAPEVRRLLQAAHESKLSTLVIDTLQHSLGYYFLPLRLVGENEPPIGSEASDRLRSALQAKEIDLYDVKQQLIELLQPPPAIKTVVFDLDGTLLNTLQSLASCYNRVLSKHGFQTHDTSAFRHFIGNGARQCMLACLRASGELEQTKESEIESLIQAQRDDYEANWDKEVEVYRGIEALLLELSNLKVTLAVLTNKDHDFAQSCVNHFFPDKPFTVIQGYTADVPHKPDPTGAQQIAERCNCSTTEMMLVGDTRVDIATAIAAGMKSVGVLWGFRDRNELEVAGADFIVSDANEILRLPDILRLKAN